jgi:hypothetical protein
MRYVEFIGAVGVDIFPCGMCGKMAKFKYMKYPHPAVARFLVDRAPLEICRKCAKREVGNKNKTAWKEIHEEK